ncbi:MAG: glycyl-radical enzyme activating protein [Victivallales bacterium]|nr:glycyl-radical enzyme activating protein [Victivallales bacterium]
MTGLTGISFDIYRGTTHDGPGMRTTVFFKGCPLSCAWCHNPEGISYAREVWWDQAKCIGCLQCLEVCPENAIISGENGIFIDRSRCKRCGKCAQACPALAMTFVGNKWNAEELVREVLKDRHYFEAFGGGVTASGGEPLGQYEFVAEFFRQLKAQGVHTALDTCGLAPAKAFRVALPFVDCVLYDLKIFDSGNHKEFTGQSNGQILDNLKLLANYIRAAGRKLSLWIRTPLIPGATAETNNIASIAGFIRENLDDVYERWELCAFNNVCKSKYRKLNKSWTYEHTRLMTQAEIDQVTTAAITAGADGERLVVSGIIAKDEGNRELQKS